jgi:peptidoglycan/xylan/chitin deacetylase (PgdA/CDA1 family)
VTRRRVTWSAALPSLRGRWSAPEGLAERPFELPDAVAPALRFGRLRSGPAWPAELPDLDRLAPVPFATDGSAVQGDPVLLFAPAGEGPKPVCCRRRDGGVEWSIDPAAWIRAILAEDYVLGPTRPLPSRIPFVNYSRAPFALKRILTRLQDPAREAPPVEIPFPDLPLDDLVERIRELCARLAWGPAAAPRVWPRGARAAVVVSHDVDSRWILDPARADLLARIVDGESAQGFPGIWYVVADQLRFPAHDRALRRLRDAGHELGAHGWNHDGRLATLPPARQVERLERIRERMAGLGVSGLRTPWYARTPALFAAIAGRFAHDSSVPNASAFFSTRSRSGCCALTPWEPVPGLVELPMTLPPDTALPVARRRAEQGALADAIVARGGLVVVTLHPQPHQSGNAAGVEAHLGLLRDVRERHGAALWGATPAAIVEWYRGLR